MVDIEVVQRRKFMPAANFKPTMVTIFVMMTGEQFIQGRCE